MTDYTPYIVIEEPTFAKMIEYLDVAKSMAVKDYPHLVNDFNRVISRARERAESFTGSQNKPKTSKAYSYDKH